MADDQPGLFDQAPEAALPVDVIELGPRGFLAESFVLEALQLDRKAVHALHGDELGCPRDYHRESGGYVYTQKGIERLASLFGLVVTVRPFVTGEHGEARFWWQEDNR